MNNSPLHIRWFVAGAALLLFAAGVIHLVIVPLHWNHALAHGLFFALVGIAEIIWAIRVWRRPSVSLHAAGIVMAGGLLILWSITRVLPAPFGHGPEQVETFGVACKLAEGVALAPLIALVFQETATRAGYVRAWRATGLLILASLVVGLLTYGIARAAEPVLPWLSEASEQPHAHDQHQEEQEHPMTPEAEHAHEK
jgi:hypothetical protein